MQTATVTWVEHRSCEVDLDEARAYAKQKNKSLEWAIQEIACGEVNTRRYYTDNYQIEMPALEKKVRRGRGSY